MNTLHTRLERIETALLPPPPARPAVIAGIPVADVAALLERIARDGRHITELSQ